MQQHASHWTTATGGFGRFKQRVSAGCKYVINRPRLAQGKLFLSSGDGVADFKPSESR